MNQEIRQVILGVLGERKEAYSVDFWLAWPGRTGNKRRDLGKVTNVLLAMRTLGEIEYREVRPDEHGQSQYARQYYRRVSGHRNEGGSA